jgi:hypothetical protein
MIWVTWRQHRMQWLFGAVTLSILGAILLATGPAILSAFRSSGAAACLTHPGTDCGGVTGTFLDRFTNLQFLVPLFLILPALGGLFWGAPLLAREVEQGTHRLAWTQGVTRERWFLVKVAAMAAMAALGIAIVTWGLAWWSRPLVIAGDDRFNPGIFDIRGPVAVAYALFAVALGIAMGALIRRTVPAMAATLAGFTAVRLVVDLWVRRHLMAHKVVSWTFLKGASPRTGMGDWVLSTKAVDAAGRLLGLGGGVDLDIVAKQCPALARNSGEFPGKDVIQTCLQRIGAHLVAVYQPGNRYWSFQWIETGLFLLLSVALVTFSLWWVKRKIS